MERLRLGLLGYPITHSLSPKLYQELLGTELESYELFSCPTPDRVPSLADFSSRLHGLNITSPYKTHFIDKVIIQDQLARELAAVNTLAFAQDQVYATNTDLIAVKEILLRYQSEYPLLQIILLGDGVMARLTQLLAGAFNIPVKQISRKLTPQFSGLNLSRFHVNGVQSLVINSCSRAYICDLEFTGEELFWDYNYAFLPHEQSIPSRVKTYCDGQEMLILQAKAAIRFWGEVRAKLN